MATKTKVGRWGVVTEQRKGQSGPQAADEATAPGWTPVWAMPNVTLDAPIEASHAALVPSNDERLVALALQKPALMAFLSAFRDEFGNQISPTIGLVREDARKSVLTVTAFGGFRDAVCISAVITGQTRTAQWGHSQGILHSDAFDVYPWFPSPQWNGHIAAFTPALSGQHMVDELRPQSAPALGRRFLTAHHLDKPLLDALVARWERCFATGDESVEDRRLFRALDMARAASKIPGGSDASEHDVGRAVALWVSAFEILAHDGKQSHLGRVLALLAKVEWLRPELKEPDREVRAGGGIVRTNLAGGIYKRLNKVRNDFLHGNRVDGETLKLEKGKSVLLFAAPLFRLALTAYLNLRFVTEFPSASDADLWGELIGKRMQFHGPQRDCEAAILSADMEKRPTATSTQQKQGEEDPRSD
jgi:hypothetical protein